MMEAQFPTYTLEVTVVDNLLENKVGKQAFWNALLNKTGCDEALKAVQNALSEAGIKASVRFKRFDWS